MHREQLSAMKHTTILTACLILTGVSSAAYATTASGSPPVIGQSSVDPLYLLGFIALTMSGAMVAMFKMLTDHSRRQAEEMLKHLRADREQLRRYEQRRVAFDDRLIETQQELVRELRDIRIQLAPTPGTQP